MQVVYLNKEEEKETAECAVCKQWKIMQVELVSRLGAPSSVKTHVSVITN